MLLHDARYYFIITLLTVSFALAANRKAESRSAKATASDRNGTSTNFARRITTLLANFAELTTPDRGAVLDAAGSEYFVDVLRYEFCTMTTGDRFIVSPPTDKKLERRERVVAFAVGVVWMTVAFSEKADSVLNKALKEAVTQHWSTRTPLTMQTIQSTLQTFIRVLKEAFEDDPILSVLFASAQKEYGLEQINQIATPKVYFPLKDVTRGKVNNKMVDAWLDELGVRQCIIHTRFLDLRKNAGVDSVWVTSFFILAGEADHFSDMMDVYAKAVKDAAANATTADALDGAVAHVVDKVSEAVLAKILVKGGGKGQTM